MPGKRSLAWVAGPALAVACALAFCPAEADASVNVTPTGASSLEAAPVAVETAAESATPPVGGVQDSWMNSCDSDPYQALLPGQADKAHGYADEAVPAVDSPYWAALDMNTVRFSPTWDIAYPRLTGKDATAVSIERTCFNYWLGRLAAKGVSAEIAFKPDYCYQNPAGCPDNQTGRVLIPALSRYEAAVSAFVKAYPQVKIIAPWGEPDFQPGGSEPKFSIGHPGGANFGQASCPRRRPTVSNCGPMLAAQMWVAVRHRCPSCTVIAGDFGGNPGHDKSYFPVYQKYLRDLSGGHKIYHPAVWGIHPYGDMETAEQQIQGKKQRVTEPVRNTLVAGFASWLKADGYGASTQIWLDEISSFTYSSKTSDCAKHNDCFSPQTQRKGAVYLFNKLAQAPTAAQPRVTRIYYMRFAGNTPDSLVNGTPRLVYQAVKNRPKRQAQARGTAPSSRPASPKPKARANRAAPRRSAPAAVPSSQARYEIRNRADSLCLDANDLGPTAGHNGDQVQLWNCYGSANQEWIPQYKAGQLAWLVNAKYPGMCLNADNAGGLANGRKVQLWNCYNTPNELWNVGTLLANPVSSPLSLGSGGSQSLALDADKYHLGNGDKVQVWAYYGGGSQLWYPVPG